jgi:hypothetical protein
VRDRLQVWLPVTLKLNIRNAARRSRLSTRAWVRQALERALKEPAATFGPLDRLAGIGAPEGDIDQMLAEIASGRGR